VSKAEMMKHLIQYELEDGASVFVEVEHSGDTPARERVGRGGLSVEKAEMRFVNAVATIRPAAEAVLQALHELHAPDDIELEFGIKFNAKAGAIIASVDSEATFKISLRWCKKK
jgi:hypothetical protein